MHYRPFRFEDYPELRAERLIYLPDFRSQTLIRVLNYFDGVCRFSTNTGLAQEHFEVDFSKGAVDFEKLSPPLKRALLYRLSGLEDVDRQDIFGANEPRNTQFEVTRFFRSVSQSYGGRRYVALCRDAIDANMGHSLHPFMYVDLVQAIYASYNKNVNHDATGVLDGILEMLRENELTSDELRAIISLIASKSNRENYDYFCVLCKEDPALSRALLSMKVDSLIPSRNRPGEYVPTVTVKEMLEFPKEDVIAVLRETPGGMRELVRGFFSESPRVDPDYVTAYLSNPFHDATLITVAPFFESLPDEVKRKVSSGRSFTVKTSNIEIIHAFSALRSPDEEDEFFASCRAAGRGELAKALKGEPFLLTSFTLNDLAELMPYVDLSVPLIVSRVASYLLPIVQRGIPSASTDRILASLKGPGFDQIIQTAINRDFFHSRANRLRVLKQNGLLTKEGYREWRYHA